MSVREILIPFIEYMLTTCTVQKMLAGWKLWRCQRVPTSYASMFFLKPQSNEDLWDWPLQNKKNNAPWQIETNLESRAPVAYSYQIHFSFRPHGWFSNEQREAELSAIQSRELFVAEDTPGSDTRAPRQSQDLSSSQFRKPRLVLQSTHCPR